MAHVNPLHSPVSSAQYSSYSSLSGALIDPGHKFESPFRRWLPQKSYVPPSKWRQATATNNRHLPPLSFDYIGFKKQGIPMRELSARSITALGQMIAGANDPVFASTGLKSVTLRIMWPGYTHLDFYRVINVVTGSGHITRAQLASTIAQNFARFVEHARNERPDAVEYAIGPTAIQFEHLVLVGFHNTFEDVWQADVAIDRR
ncbi:hypothetical protein CC1G_07899 [Coprinopsis cinerea okayama7|uniref:Uncharacterized protein n=1 Tax=Coprinopsis cinerea (strain Okayama-7 / 130 / ATCC MYA-4618 / FGSC 9003) TaxID=240176 RepID=A8P6M0_COPC7|nr:hypothetical protein CC1G_07899 [Coprinopsis cinerea okayama7\|eukprot:XP_001839184.1 hypothetical protein CC1G_07899 [Coprinopsis cinerea okayama7\